MTTTDERYPGAEVPVPWEDQTRFGPTAAFILTARVIFTRPVETFGRMPRHGSLGLPLLYAIICHLLGQLFTLIWSLPLSPLVAPALNLPAIPFFGSLAFLLTPLAVALGLATTSLVVHAALILMGEDHRGFETTFRGLAYASTPVLLTIFPVFGAIAAALWSMALAVLALERLHGTSTGRAVAALALGFTLLVGGSVVVGMLLTIPFSLGMSVAAP